MKAFKDVPLERDRPLDPDHDPQGLRADRPRRPSTTPARHKRRSVTIVEKPNVLRETGGLMLAVSREVGQGLSPTSQLKEANIDAMCMWLVKNPQDYDVLVAENLFGDIISDLAAQLVGGLGFASAGNIGDKYAVFEPTHGSAPKYAGHVQGQPDRHVPGREADARMAGRDGQGPRRSRAPWPRSSRKARSGPTTWAARPRRSRWPRPSRPSSERRLRRGPDDHRKNHPVAFARRGRGRPDRLDGPRRPLGPRLRRARTWSRTTSSEYGAAPPADVRKTFFTFDLCAPACSLKYADNQQLCRDFARKHGIRVFDVDRGIGSHVLIEEGLARPGATVVGTDSHMNILGAVGRFGQGMGDVDIAFAFKTGQDLVRGPGERQGRPQGDARARGRGQGPDPLPVPRAGDEEDRPAARPSSRAGGRRALDSAGRITLCSMITEMAGIIGFIPEEGGARGRSRAPRYADVDRSRRRRPPAAGRASPPSPNTVQPLAEVRGVRIDSGFIGSCTNGRTEDFAGPPTSSAAARSSRASC